MVQCTLKCVQYGHCRGWCWDVWCMDDVDDVCIIVQMVHTFCCMVLWQWAQKTAWSAASCVSAELVCGWKSFVSATVHRKATRRTVQFQSNYLHLYLLDQLVQLVTPKKTTLAIMDWRNIFRSLLYIQRNKACWVLCDQSSLFGMWIPTIFTSSHRLVSRTSCSS